MSPIEKVGVGVRNMADSNSGTDQLERQYRDQCGGRARA